MLLYDDSLLCCGSLVVQFFQWLFHREFYYIQMEKYARQALAEGVKTAKDLLVTTDAELYRILVVHYNRNCQIEVNI